jgi:hypothetical protein
MSKKTISEVVGAIVEELTPLGSEERRRVIHAVMTLLGEEVVKIPHPGAEQGGVSGAEGLNVRAKSWMRQNNLSMEQLEQTFLIQDEAVEVIATVPGNNNKEKVRNAYVLTGISQFLRTGDQRFDDSVARSLCERLGFYDRTNHAKYMKGGNEFTGSKESGWTVTIPGLKAGANLIKDIGSHG